MFLPWFFNVDVLLYQFSAIFDFLINETEFYLMPNKKPTWSIALIFWYLFDHISLHNT